MRSEPRKPKPEEPMAPCFDHDDPEQYDAETELEGAVLRMASRHADGIATADLMDLIRDVVHATDACRRAGTTHASVINIIEDAFGAWTDKELDRDAIKAHGAA